MASLADSRYNTMANIYIFGLIRMTQAALGHKNSRSISTRALVMF